MKSMWRQGDLLIVKVKDIPKKAVKKTNGILAEGEVTGHMHELDSGEVYAVGETLYFRVSESEQTVLNHPDHGSITFEPGEYKVIRQREYEPDSWKKSRRVSD
ncbi:MAG: hypothetical protein A2036_01710 [Omnitrophica bacterium GWA2_50_21]|nr:MAG: hypothetical protein A2036_01710 [Omnitrophica bacterium GWA2_50_21]